MRGRPLPGARSIEPVIRSLRRKSCKPRLLHFFLRNSLIHRFAPQFFDSDKFLMKILYSFVIILTRDKRRHSSTNYDVFMTSLLTRCLKNRPN